MTKTHAVLAALILAGLAGGAAAQDSATPLPAICGVVDAHAGHGVADAHAGHGAAASVEESAALPSAAHEALVAGMDRMHRDMDAGSRAEDIDVAFACGMIPHHQGAIDMARAVLAHGDDPWIASLAEGIIAAQEQEIADMLAWLATQADRIGPPSH